MALEDFTAYTEVDPNSKITVTATKIDMANLRRDESAWVIFDKGSAFFEEDIDIDFETYTINANGFVGHLFISNLIDDYRAHEVASSSFFAIVRDSAEDLVIVERDGASGYPDTSALSAAVLYYCTFIRDESVGTYGTIYCYIYDDSGRTNLVDTVSITLHTSKKDFQYYYGGISYNDSTAGSFTGYSQNHEIFIPSAVTGDSRTNFNDDALILNKIRLGSGGITL